MGEATTGPSQVHHVQSSYAILTSPTDFPTTAEGTPFSGSTLAVSNNGRREGANEEKEGSGIHPMHVRSLQLLSRAWLRLMLCRKHLPPNPSHQN